MARINVEDTIWLDPRFKALREELGEFKAIGVLVVFWRLSQEQFKQNKKITELQFKLAGLPEALFDFDLAERSENGIRAKGDREHHAWVIERQCAGRAGGQRTQAKKRELNENKDLVQANVKQNQASSSSSFSKKETTLHKPNGCARLFDLEKIYEGYPRKLGKKRGLARLKTVVKDQITFDKVLLATKNYASHCVREKKEDRFIMHFSTFVGIWEDWLQAPTVNKPKFLVQANEKDEKILNAPFPETNHNILRLLREAGAEMEKK